MSNTHSIPSVASFDANPRCILPDAIIDPISDELQAIEKLAERLRGHAEGHVHADDPRTLGQLDSAGLLHRDRSHRGRLGEARGIRCGSRTAGATKSPWS
jgi:hypothetical protein